MISLIKEISQLQQLLQKSIHGSPGNWSRITLREPVL